MHARRGNLLAMALKRGALVLALALGAVAAAADGPAGGGVLLERTVTPGAGDRFTRVEFTCWLPEPGRPVRAVIIHQHGCGNSSAAANPPVARDFHWQALARRHDCAVLVPHYTVTGDCADWNDPDSGSERALLAALRDFGVRSARPELETASWILWGHSGGSSWGMQMVLRHRARILAASLRGGAHKQFGDAAFRARFVAVAHDLPLLFVWGRGETVPTSRHFVSWEPMQAMYRELRAAGGRVALALDPRTEHDCGDARLLVIPYFDAVLAAHREQAAPRGVWVDATTRELAPAEAGRSRDPAQAWLPSQAVAAQWKMFSETGTVVPARAPSRKPVLEAAWDEAARGVELHWRVEPELDGGLRLIRIFRDGVLWREIGRREAKFLTTSRDSPPHGLHAASARDETLRAGAKPVYTLAFVDAAGAESPGSEPATPR